MPAWPYVGSSVRGQQPLALHSLVHLLHRQVKDVDAAVDDDDEYKEKKKERKKEKKKKTKRKFAINGTMCTHELVLVLNKPSSKQKQKGTGSNKNYNIEFVS